MIQNLHTHRALLLTTDTYILISPIRDELFRTGALLQGKVDLVYAIELCCLGEESVERFGIMHLEALQSPAYSFESLAHEHSSSLNLHSLVVGYR